MKYKLYIILAIALLLLTACKVETAEKNLNSVSTPITVSSNETVSDDSSIGEIADLEKYIFININSLNPENHSANESWELISYLSGNEQIAYSDTWENKQYIDKEKNNFFVSNRINKQLYFSDYFVCANDGNSNSTIAIYNCDWDIKLAKINYTSFQNCDISRYAFAQKTLANLLNEKHKDLTLFIREAWEFNYNSHNALIVTISNFNDAEINTSENISSDYQNNYSVLYYGCYMFIDKDIYIPIIPIQFEEFNNGDNGTILSYFNVNKTIENTFVDSSEFKSLLSYRNLYYPRFFVADIDGDSYQEVVTYKDSPSSLSRYITAIKFINGEYQKYLIQTNF